MDISGQTFEHISRPENENLSIAGYFRFLRIATVDSEMDGQTAEQPAPQSSNGMDAATNKSSRLLGLPAEVRERIWHYLLVSPTGFIKPFRSGVGEKSLLKYDYHAFNPKTGRYRKPWHYDSGAQIHLSILCCSRSIYDECAHVFWGRNTFILDSIDDFLATGLLGERGRASSCCRKIRYVQLDINISRVMAGEPAQSLMTALATLERMADPTKGSLESIIFRPVASLLCLEMALDTVALAPIYLQQLNTIFDVFEEIDRRGGLEPAAVKRTVAIDIYWDERCRVERLQFFKGYKVQADFLLDSLALYMGGKKGKLLVDGKLCLESLDGKVERRSDSFPLLEGVANVKE